MSFTQIVPTFKKVYIFSLFFQLNQKFKTWGLVKAGSVGTGLSIVSFKFVEFGLEDCLNIPYN